jgi:hypothetical protein
MGGGSAHGYKMGATVGEMRAKLIDGETEVNPIISFNRFKNLTEKVERR